MNWSSYQEVLADLEKDKELIHIICNKLKTEYDVQIQKSGEIENAISIIRSKLEAETFFDETERLETSSETQQVKHNFTLLPKNEYSKENQSKVSLCSASEEILEKAGKPLHLSVIIKELEKFGRFTDSRILNGTIRKDHKKRFVNLGQNVWNLSRRQEQSKSE